MDPDLQAEYNRLRDSGMSPEQAEQQARYNISRRQEEAATPERLDATGLAAVRSPERFTHSMLQALQGLPFVGAWTDEALGTTDRMKEMEGKYGVGYGEQLMGGVATGLPLLRAAGAAPTLLGMMGVGGLEGASVGAGVSEPGQRGRGAVMGGVLGVATAGAARPVGAISRWVGETARGVGANALSTMRGRLTRGQAVRNVQDLADRFTPQRTYPAGAGDTFADVVEGGPELSGTYMRELADDPATRATVAQAAEARLQTVPTQVKNAVEDLTGVPRGQSRMAITQAAKDESRDFFDRQYTNLWSRLDDAGVADNESIRLVLNREGVEDARLAAVADINNHAARRGDALIPENTVNAEVLDRTARALDDMARGADGKLLPGGGRLANAASQLRSRLGEYAGYDDVRRLYAQQRTVDAAAAGKVTVGDQRRAWTAASEADLLNFAQNAPERAQAALRSAISADIEDSINKKIANVSPESPLRELSDRLEGKLRIIFGDGAVDAMNANLDRLGRQILRDRSITAGQRAANRMVPGAGGMDAPLTAATVAGYGLAGQAGAGARTSLQSIMRSGTTRQAQARQALGLLMGNPQASQDVFADALRRRAFGVEDTADLYRLGSLLGGRIGGLLGGG